MTKSPDLGVPLLAQSQANPDITHNEALLLFQALSNGVINLTTAAPPGSPTEGDSYVIAAAPTGAWTGFANHIAIYWGGAWRFVPGRDGTGAIITIGARHEGLRVYDRNTNALYVWTGSAWSAYSSTDPTKVAKAGDTMTGPLEIGPIASGFAFEAHKGSFTEPTWNANVDTALFKGGAAANIAVQLLSNTGFTGTLAFSSPTVRNNGLVNYDHGANRLGLGADANNRFFVTGTAEFLDQGLVTLITPNSLWRTRVFTVATLPVTNIASGDTALVTDANATGLGTIVAGGGANRVPVNYDGTNWRIG